MYITPGQWGTLAGHAILGGANAMRVSLGLGPGGYTLTELRMYESVHQRAQGETTPPRTPPPRRALATPRRAATRVHAPRAWLAARCVADARPALASRLAACCDWPGASHVHATAVAFIIAKLLP